MCGTNLLGFEVFESHGDDKHIVTSDQAQFPSIAGVSGLATLAFGIHTERALHTGTNWGLFLGHHRCDRGGCKWLRRTRSQFVKSGRFVLAMCDDVLHSVQRCLLHLEGVCVPRSLREAERRQPGHIRGEHTGIYIPSIVCGTHSAFGLQGAGSCVSRDSSQPERWICVLCHGIQTERMPGCAVGATPLHRSKHGLQHLFSESVETIFSHSFHSLYNIVNPTLNFRLRVPVALPRFSGQTTRRFRCGCSDLSCRPCNLHPQQSKQEKEMQQIAFSSQRGLTMIHLCSICKLGPLNFQSGSGNWFLQLATNGFLLSVSR